MLSGCGYAVGPAAVDPLGPFAVEARAGLVPDAAVVAAAEAAARAELARSGALAPPSCRGCARIAIDVSSVREGPGAIGVSPASPDPIARALEVVVTGRARVLAPGPRPGPRAPLRETPYLHAIERVAFSADPSRAQLGRDVAARRAAARLGQNLAARLLGRPAPGEWTPGL